MRTLWQDIRYGVRVLAKSPGFTLVAVLALALGIGANTAIFSVVNGVLLRPLPFEDSERLVQVYESNLKKGWLRDPISPLNFVAWQEQSRSFDSMAAYEYESFALTGGDAPERLAGLLVTADFDDVMGIKPRLGRGFLPEEDDADASRAVIISDRLWRRRFGGREDVIGRTLTLNDENFTIVGVMPPGIQFPSQSIDLYATPAIDRARPRSEHFLHAVARLKPDVSLARAQGEMDTIARRLAEARPNTNKNSGVRLVELHEERTGKIRPSLLVLCGAVGMVLLIACANVANLFLARAAARRREIAVRSALGASRLRIVRQLLTESVLLSLLGGVAGLLLAVWGVDLLTSAGATGIPRLTEVGVDRQAFGFTLFVSVLTGLVFGFVPAWRGSKADFNSSLKEGSRSQTAGRGRGRFRDALVVAQIALALMLTIGAGLFLKSFQLLRQLDAGFDPANVLTMQVALPEAKYPEGHKQSLFFDSVLARISTLPGVSAAGVVTNLPLGGSKESSSFDFAGEASDNIDADRNANTSTISSHYFRAMDISLTRGRAFADGDRRNSPGVVIVNEAFARAYFKGEDPLGKRLVLGGSQEQELYGEAITREVVGVVEDARFKLDEEAAPEVYVPYTQRPMDEMTIVIRAAADPANLTPAVRAAVLAVDKDQPIHNVKLMEQWLAESIASRTLVMKLTGLFAFLALVLAGVGIYGVMAYTVAQRTHEIGIRMALGARGADVLRLVVGQGMVLALLGVALGVAGALAAARVMASLLYGVSATDPVTFVGVALLLSAVAVLACYIPARRATKVDPMIALRYE